MNKYIPLMEATYTKKYKCPYCELRLDRTKLPIHIQNKHEELIPEGFTALRVAFNTINKKDTGHCIVCGQETAWNEIKGRYERLCGRKECKDKWLKMTKERTKKKYGTERPSADPRYKSEIQRKALANRKVAGKYKFSDGGEIEYMGSYEKKLLEFLDKIMLINSEDIIAPGPDINYTWNGQEHLYLPDFYYIPYNLIIEVKDGGDNPNNNPEFKTNRKDRLEAKEAAVKALNKYNYIRLTNNDFGQLMSMFGLLKMQLTDNRDDDEILVKINESSLLESSNSQKLYFVSGSNKDGATLIPRIPNNYMTKNGYEDSTIPRVCFSESIDGCLIGLSKNLDGEELYVHIPVGDYKVIIPTTKQVPDVNLTKERWICEYVKIQCIGKILVKDNGKPGMKYKYGNGKEAELFSWDWKWIEKYNEYTEITDSDINIVNELFNRDDVESFEDISESELQAFYKLSGLSEDNYLTEFDIEDSNKNFNKDPLYIVLMDLDMLRNKIIKGFTRSQYSHAAISFDPVLDNMYSFANERDDDANVIRTGFTSEKKSTYLKINPNCKMKLFSLFINNDQMNNIKKLVDFYKNNIFKTAYNMFSIIGIVLHKKLKRATNDPLNMICSQFVYTILLAAQIHSNLKKDASRVTPGDINKLSDNRLYTIFEGYLKQYKINDAINMTNKIYNNIFKKNINESIATSTIAAALAPWPVPFEANKDNYYIIQHMQNNVYDYSITKDPVQCTMYSIDPEEGYKVYKSDKGKIEKSYLTFKMKDKRKAKEIYDEMVNKYNNHESANSSDYIYYAYTGNHILDETQLMFDNRLELVYNFFEELSMISDKLYRYLKPSNLDLLEEQVNSLLEAEDNKNYEDPDSIYMIMPNDINTIEGLERWKNQFNQLTYYQKVISNDMSIRKYGKNNIDRYNELRNKLNSQISPDDNTNTHSTTQSISSNVVVKEDTALDNDRYYHDNWDDRLLQVKSAESSGLVIMIDNLCGEFIDMYDDDSIERLKNKWEKFNSLSIDQRTLSDQTALNIFGINNYNLYTKIINAYESRKLEKMKNEKDKMDNNISSNESTHIYPYYAFNEISKKKIYSNENSVDNKIIDDIQDQIKKDDLKEDMWTELIESLYIKRSLPKYKDSINEINQSIYELGWNPEIPFSREVAKITNKRYNYNIFESFDMKDFYKYYNENGILNNQSKYNKNIDFIYTTYFKNPSNNAYELGISLESDLSTIYLFHPNNSLENTRIIKRNYSQIFNENDNIQISLLGINKNAKKDLIEILNSYTESGNMIRNNKDVYTDYFGDKLSLLYEDFNKYGYKMNNVKSYIIYEGSIYNYNHSITDVISNKLQKCFDYKIYGSINECAYNDTRYMDIENYLNEHSKNYIIKEMTPISFLESNTTDINNMNRIEEIAYSILKDKYK